MPVHYLKLLPLITRLEKLENNLIENRNRVDLQLNYLSLRTRGVSIWSQSWTFAPELSHEGVQCQRVPSKSGFRRIKAIFRNLKSRPSESRKRYPEMSNSRKYRLQKKRNPAFLISRIRNLKTPQFIIWCFNSVWIGIGQSIGHNWKPSRWASATNDQIPSEGTQSTNLPSGH